LGVAGIPEKEEKKLDKQTNKQANKHTSKQRASKPVQLQEETTFQVGQSEQG